MRACLCVLLVAASRDFFQVPVASTNGFLATTPVARERLEVRPERVYELMSPAYLTPADRVPVAGPYTEAFDLPTTAAVVAMCAVIGYGIGRATSHPTSRPQKLSRPKPLRSRVVVMAEEAAEAAPPAPVAAVDPKASYNRGDINTMIGTYQWKDSNGNKIFDPLNLASKYDVNWLREAELKHGRVTMLATVGFLANDLGIKFPGEKYAGISSVDAHDAMVQTGDMWTLLIAVGICELAHASKIVPKLDGDWEDWEPGNYGIDPFGWASDATREAEIKHSRLAMMAFGGLVTQSALGYPVTSYFG